MEMQQAQQPAQAGFFSPTENAPQEQESFENEQENAFSIDSNQVESAIKDHVDDRQESDLNQLLDAGNDLLFGKDTHYQLMDQLQSSKDIGADLGGGAFSLMTMIIKEKNGRVPGEVVLPAGVILFLLLKIKCLLINTDSLISDTFLHIHALIHHVRFAHTT